MPKYYAKVWKILITASCETIGNTLNITRDQILPGWNYLTGHWQQVQRPPADFEQMFSQIGGAFTPISLRLGLLCQQTEYRLLTGIVTTFRAIRGFRDFLWTAIFDLVYAQTGLDEYASVLAFRQYTDGGQALTGHWAGW